MNVYLPDANRRVRRIKAIQDFVTEIQINKPKAIVMVCGDFNCKTKPLKLHSLTPDGPTFRRTINQRLTESRTDWMLSSQQLPSKAETIWSDLSDHGMLVARLKIESASPRANEVHIINRDNCY